MTYSTWKNSGRAYGWKEVGIGSIISIFLLLCFYPDFLILEKTPMFCSGWGLKDPVVSYTNFRPCFNVVQHELYTNGNILWSSLRSMGMPILANDIQTAPIFPITLLFSWIQENIYWNIIVLSRLFLMSLGTFLLLRRFFGFRILPAIFFVISFVYALYVVRWMNHPWQNGLLAGIWYLYFLCRLIDQKSGYSIRRFGIFIGLIISVYAMVTTGFPEASVMAAFWIIFTYLPFVAYSSWKKRIVWKQYLFELFVAHCVGFALSSYQIFSILELMSVSGTYGRNVGFDQYSPADIIPFFLEILTQVKTSAPVLFKDSRTFLGLIPLTFFFVGLGLTLRNIRKIGYGEMGAILCGMFIIFKLFAIGPQWFNSYLASLPILKETYFYIYFFSIFLWFFAYFSARGFQAFIEVHNQNPGKRARIGWIACVATIVVLVCALLSWSAQVVYDQSLWELLTLDRQNIFLLLFILFLSSVIFIIKYLFIEKNSLPYRLIPILIIGLVIIEKVLTLPADFRKMPPGYENPQLQVILQRLQERNIPLVESRMIDRLGSYVSEGLATIDNGSTPLLPERTGMFKSTFFNGVMPRGVIRSPKNSLSWAISSTNIRAVDRFYGGGEEFFPSWETMEKVPGNNIHLDFFGLNSETLPKKGKVTIQGKPNDFLVLKGWAIGDRKKGLADTAVFIVFKGKEGEIAVPTRSASRPDVARHLGEKKFSKAGWEGFLSTGILPEGRHEVFVRFVDYRSNVYYEHESGSVIFYDHSAESEEKLHYPEADLNEFLGMLGLYYVYLDRNTLPRAYTASGCTSFAGKEEVVHAFRKNTDFELGHVYLENIDAADRLCRDHEAQVERVPILYDKGKELLLQKVQGPTLLMLNDNFYPGWKAKDTIEGTALEIVPGNITFRALLLPENREYQVLFSYQPDWILLARLLVLSGLAAIIMVSIVYIGKRK